MSDDFYSEGVIEKNESDEEGLQLKERSEALANSAGIKNSESDKKLFILKDITEIYPSSLLEVKKEVLEEVECSLSSNKFLVLSCYSKDVLASVCLYLRDRSALMHHFWGYFDPDDEEYLNNNNEEMSYDFFNQLFKSNPVLEKEKSIIVIEVSNGERGRDLYNLLLGNEQRIERVNRRLTSLKLTIIFLVVPVYTLNKSEILNDQFYEIGYIEPMIKSELRDKELQRGNNEASNLNFNSNDNYNNILNACNDFRRRGGWSSEKDFFDVFFACYQERRIEESIKSLKESQGNSLNEDKLKEFSCVFNESQLGKALLYVAIFFSNDYNSKKGFGLSEFSEVVSEILKDEMISLTKRGRIISPLENRKDKDSDYKINAPEFWVNNRDRLLKENGLIVLNVNDCLFVSFDDVFLRHALSDYLKKHFAFLVRDMSNKVLKAGLLFNSSNGIGNAVNNLAVMMINWDSNYYNDDWFFNIIASYCGGSSLKCNGSSKEKVLRDTFQSLDGKYKSFFLHRVANLLKEIHLHGKSSQIISKVLERFMRNEMSEIVLSLVILMRSLNNFDSLYWIKQVIERGNNFARNKAFRLLHNQILYSGEQMGELIEVLISWLPEPDRYNYSRANEMAVSLLLVILLDSTLEFDVRSYGQWPTRHRVLNQLLIGKNLDNQLLCQILIHPKLIDVLAKSASNQDLTALLKGKWQIILRGADYNVATGKMVDDIYNYLAIKVLEEMQASNFDFETILLKAARKSREKILIEAKEIFPVLIAEWYLVIEGLKENFLSDENNIVFDEFLYNLVSSYQSKVEIKSLDMSLKKTSALIREAVDYVKSTSIDNRDRKYIIKPLLEKRCRINDLRKKITKIQSELT